jgi:hypothetical protein
VIRGLRVVWPLPWQSILSSLRNKNLVGQTVAIRAASQRVLAMAQAGTAPGISGSYYLDATNRAEVVYAFEGMGRGDAQLLVAHNGGFFSGRVSLGAITQNFGRKPNKIMPDGTYFSARLGQALVYAGYLDHWGIGQDLRVAALEQRASLAADRHRTRQPRCFKLTDAALAGAGAI